MASSKYPIQEPQREIIIERRELVGRIVEGHGSDPMVVAAFKVAGEYLNDLASRADQDPVEIEFEYLGVKFQAGFHHGSNNRDPFAEEID